MDASVLARDQRVRLPDGAKGLDVVLADRELQVLSLTGSPQELHELEEPADLQTLLRPGQEALGVGALIAR
jgi:hypothetical protein